MVVVDVAGDQAMWRCVRRRDLYTTGEREDRWRDSFQMSLTAPGTGAHMRETWES